MNAESWGLGKEGQRSLELVTGLGQEEEGLRKQPYPKHSKAQPAKVIMQQCWFKYPDHGAINLMRYLSGGLWRRGSFPLAGCVRPREGWGSRGLLREGRSQAGKAGKLRDQ